MLTLSPVHVVVSCAAPVTVWCAWLLFAGGVKLVFDVGFQREEVNTPNIGIDFANTQVHVVTIRRSNKGRRVVVQVSERW